MKDIHSSDKTNKMFQSSLNRQNSVLSGLSGHKTIKADDARVATPLKSDLNGDDKQKRKRRRKHKSYDIVAR